MMLRCFILTLLLLLGLGTGLEAQSRQQERNVDNGWIATLLRMREQLRLSPEQISQLRQIDDRTEDLNRPHVAALHRIRVKTRALGPMDQLTPEQHQLYQSYFAEARPYLDRINQNLGAAAREVSQVLSPWQKERIRELLNNSGSNRERSSNTPSSRSRGQ